MMAEESYTFDPCSIDGSDKEKVTLDNYKPTVHKPLIVPSSWRQNQIGDNFNQQPGMDELKKIMMYLKRKASDSEIMKAFGITAETLVSIKKDKYDPVEGISLDNQSKIYKEFKRLEDRIDSLLRGINFISECMFTDRISKDAYKKSFRKPKKEKKEKIKGKAEVISEKYDNSKEISEDFVSIDEEIDGSGEEE
jgi:DNA-binding Xre family transcriptional regulator